jgi:hypothetical protein
MEAYAMRVMLLASASVLALIAGAAAGQTSLPMVMKSNHRALHFTPHNGSRVLYDQAQSSGFSAYAISSVTLESPSYSIWDSAGADDFVLPEGKHMITAVYAPGMNAYGTGYGAAAMDVIFYKTIERNGKVKVLKSCPSSPNSDTTGRGDMMVDVSSCKVKLKGGKHDYSVSIRAITPSGEGQNNWWYWQTNKKQVGTQAWWENEGGGFHICTAYYSPIWQCLSSVGPDLAFEIIGK